MTTETKKRYMACSRCRSTKFEIYNNELIHEYTLDEILCFNIDVERVTRFRCLMCGLENSTIAVFERSEDNIDNMDKTCANCWIFKEFADNPDVTCMDECVEQTGCSSWQGEFTQEKTEQYSKV